MENATSILMFSTTYLIIFGILVGITGQGSLAFSTSEIITMMVVSGGVTIAALVILAAAAGIGILGSGSPEAGKYVWRGGLFIMIAVWMAFFVDKLAGLMPAGTPWEISTLFIGPPVVGILWGMFAVWHGSGG